MAADPFLSQPGMAERGLSGATVSGPGSVAALWHNPATLVDADTRLTFEWQSAPDRDDDGRLRGDSNNWFIGTAFVNRDKWYGTVATGIAAYTPHTMKLWVRQSGQPESAFGRVNITSQAIGVPYAVEFDHLGLAIGAVGELVALDPSGTDLRVQDVDGSVDDVEFDDSQQVGLSGALGARYIFHEADGLRIDGGAVRRLGATSGAALDPEPVRAAARLMPDRPSGYDGGLRLRRAVGEASAIEIQAQYGSTDWGSAGQIKREAVGVSLQQPFAETLMFQGGQRIVRLGASRSRAKERESWMDWPDGRAIAFGLGLFFEHGIHIDLALERRTETRDEFSAERTWFGGFGVGFRY